MTSSEKTLYSSPNGFRPASACNRKFSRRKSRSTRANENKMCSPDSAFNSLYVGLHIKRPLFQALLSVIIFAQRRAPFGRMMGGGRHATAKFGTCKCYSTRATENRIHLRDSAFNSVIIGTHLTCLSFHTPSLRSFSYSAVRHRVTRWVAAASGRILLGACFAYLPPGGRPAGCLSRSRNAEGVRWPLQ